MDIAKIFNTKEHGQLCAIRSSENLQLRPEIRVFCEPNGFGVCSSALLYDDTEEGWDTQEEVFKNLTEEQAIAIASPIFDAFKE